MAQESQNTSAVALITVIGVTAMLGVLIPVGLCSPALFHGVPISSLGAKVISVSVISFALGAWYFAAFMALHKSQRQTASRILEGQDLGVLVVPYVIYAGTKAFFSSRKR